MNQSWWISPTCQNGIFYPTSWAKFLFLLQLLSL